MGQKQGMAGEQRVLHHANNVTRWHIIESYKQSDSLQQILALSLTWARIWSNLTLGL